METPETETTTNERPVWNAGRTVGAKRALKPKQIWQIRFYLYKRRSLRDRALFDLAIDSKLRGCDLLRMKIGDIVKGGQIRTRAIVMQKKQFVLSSSRFCRMPAPVYWPGVSAGVAAWTITSSQARLIVTGTSAPANMHGLLMNGYAESA